MDISGYTPLDPKFVEACKCQICTSIENIAENVRALKLKKDCYIRIFLDANEDDYQHEGGRYLVTKIFNSNKYNLWIGNTVLGLSDSNMGMNSKKPYQAHSSTKFKVPFRVDARSAISLRKLFLWLGSRRNENGWFLSEGYLPVRKHPAGLFKAMGDVNLPESVHYLHQQKKNDDTLIDDYDFLPRFSDSIPKPVEFQNHLDCAEFDGGKKDRLSEIEAMVDKYLFNFQLRKNYGDEKVTASGQLSGELAAQIMYTRHAWHAWFRKGDAIPIAACIDRATMGPMVARLKDLETLRVMKSTMSQMLNTRFALLSYFSNKEDQDMGNYYQQQYELLKEKVQSDVSDAFGESSAEFYLATGQLLYYMMCCREGQNINYDLALRDFITARNAQVVKDQLLKKWRPTMYKDTIWNPRFNKLLSIVRTYNAPAKELVDIDALIAGFCNKNLVYMKKEEQTHEEN
ncbi:MAG TPA: hypothetical protein VN673_17640 [Clostridia bacterium]|nr:hypothetical protein [Clostridia bacterium]